MWQSPQLVCCCSRSWRACSLWQRWVGGLKAVEKQSLSSWQIKGTSHKQDHRVYTYLCHCSAPLAVAELNPLSHNYLAMAHSK
jgi:hypothetical protein